MSNPFTRNYIYFSINFTLFSQNNLWPLEKIILIEMKKYKNMNINCEMSISQFKSNPFTCISVFINNFIYFE